MLKDFRMEFWPVQIPGRLLLAGYLRGDFMSGRIAILHPEDQHGAADELSFG